VSPYWGLVLLAIIGVLVWYFWDDIYDFSLFIWNELQDKERFRQRIESYGIWGPAVFIGFQIFQVLISPVPGELVGAAGGYVFGWLLSFFYSTIGLSLGSWINFFVARFLGEGLVLRLVPPEMMRRIRSFMKSTGMIACLMAFVVPGFPKDYFCLFLGLTPINWKVFMFISSVGRIPGTLMLSLQGDLLYHENYWSFAILGAISLAFLIPVWLWRDKIYQWLYRLENGRDNKSGKK
jgi:uncharacterized membrane protein YdjX (TVP38/TMEM64 family)